MSPKYFGAMPVSYMKFNQTNVIMISHISVCWGQSRFINGLLCFCGCLASVSTLLCDQSGGGTMLSCSGGIDHTYTRGNNSVTRLELYHWPSEQLDAEYILSLFPSLEELAVVDSNVTKLISTFRRGLSLRKINMTGLLLRNIPRDTFQGLENLKYLDLRSNQLEHLEEDVLSSLPRLEQVFLAGNEWQCKVKMVWILETSFITKLKDVNLLICAKYERKPLLNIMLFLKTLEVECPAQCSCIMDHVAWSYPVNVSLLPFYTVNCSYRGLVEFPPILPGNTTTLLLQGNKIKSVEALASNPYYSRLNDVYLDNNLVESINILEGSNWLITFRVLSLRENLISEIPVYALDDAFAKNGQLARIFLGHNPWLCECTFILSFQELMKKHNNIFKDLNDVRCAYTEGDVNSLLLINSLHRTAVCKEPMIGLHRMTGLDILNISLAALIVLILSKLLYDYLTFKKTGKLPWIVMKMP